MNTLNLTLIQASLAWENKSANLEMFEEKITAVNPETDIIILPEMFSTGFTMNAAKFAEKMDGPTVSWMRTIAKKRNCVLTGSIIIEEEGKYYNRMIWMRPEGENHYDKRHLFALAHEDMTYTQGKHQWIMPYKGWKVFPLVCYDLRFPVWSRRHKKMDYDLIIYVANWPERRIAAWNTLLPARAVENQCYVAGLNRVGNDGNEVYHNGDSAVFDYMGNQVGKIPKHEEGSKMVSLSMDELLTFRQNFPFDRDADHFEIKN